MKMQNQSVDEGPNYSDDEPAILASQKEFVSQNPKKQFRAEQHFARMGEAVADDLQCDAAGMSKQFGQMRYTQPELAKKR